MVIIVLVRMRDAQHRQRPPITGNPGADFVGVFLGFFCFFSDFVLFQLWPLERDRYFCAAGANTIPSHSFKSEAAPGDKQGELGEEKS